MSEPHPHDGCDERECYDIMMSERTDLVKARREAQDSLVKTLIQLSSALLVLLAGYAVGERANFSGASYWMFLLAIAGLSTSVIAGLSEHVYSSMAYREQLSLLEKYYKREISRYDEPTANKLVGITQVIQFTAFALSLVAVAMIAVLGIGVENEQGEEFTAIAAKAPITSAGSGEQRQPGCEQIRCAADATTTTEAQID